MNVVRERIVGSRTSDCLSGDDREQENDGEQSDDEERDNTVCALITRARKRRTKAVIAAMVRPLPCGEREVIVSSGTVSDRRQTLCACPEYVRHLP